MLFGGILAATAARRFASSACRSASVNLGAFTAALIDGSAGVSERAQTGTVAVTKTANSARVMSRFIVLPQFEYLHVFHFQKYLLQKRGANNYRAVVWLYPKILHRSDP